MECVKIEHILNRPKYSRQKQFTSVAMLENLKRSLDSEVRPHPLGGLCRIIRGNDSARPKFASGLLRSCATNNDFVQSRSVCQTNRDFV